MCINFLHYKARLSLISQCKATAEVSSLPSTYISNGFRTDKRSEDTRNQSAEGVRFKGHSLLGLAWLWLPFKENCQRQKQTIQLKANSNWAERVKSLLVHECFQLCFQAFFLSLSAQIHLFNNNKC